MKKVVLLCGFVLLFGAGGFARAAQLSPGSLGATGNRVVPRSHFVYRDAETLLKAELIMGSGGAVPQLPGGTHTRWEFAVGTARALERVQRNPEALPLRGGKVLSALNRLAVEFRPELETLGMDVAAALRAIRAPLVPSDHWAYSVIDRLEKKPIAISYDDEKTPDMKTRREFAVLTARWIEKLPLSGGNAPAPSREIAESLSRLITQFEPELRALGKSPTGLPVVDVDAAKAYLAARRAKNAEPGTLDPMDRDVPTDHWAYAVIDRLQIEPRTDWSTRGRRAVSHREMAVLTLRLLDRYLKGNDVVTPPQGITPLEALALLRRLVTAFSAEMRALGVNIPVITERLGTGIGKFGVSREGLPTGHWASAAMERLWREGIFRGYPE